MATTATVSVPRTSRKTVRKARTVRSEGSIKRALRKVARMGSAAGHRAKAAAKRLARMTKAAALRVARSTKAAALKVAKLVEPVTKRIVRVYSKAANSRPVVALRELGQAAWARVAHAWRTVLRPFLQDWGFLFGAAAWLVSLSIAPLATSAVTAAAGLVALAAAQGVGWLEKSKSKLAKFTRDFLEAVAQAVRVALYVGAGAMTLLAASISLPLALVFITELVMRSIGNWTSATIPDMIRSAMNGASSQFVTEGAVAPRKPSVRVRTMLTTKSKSIEVVAPAVREVPADSPLGLALQGKFEAAVPKIVTSESRVGTTEGVAQARVLRVAHDHGIDITPADAPNNPETWTRGNTLRAKGTEELWGTAHDVPPTMVVVHDDADEGHAIAVNTPCFACGTTEPGMRSATEGSVETNGLCSPCFDAQCEEDALRFTGVSLKARHVHVPLLPAGIEASPEYIASKANSAEMQWLAMSSWRTRDNVEHARQWGLLDNGDVVGTVTYDRHTRMYDAEALGVALKSDRHKAAAKRLVKDIVMDARNSVDRALNGSAVEVESKPVELAKVFQGAFSGKKV